MATRTRTKGNLDRFPAWYDVVYRNSNTGAIIASYVKRGATYHYDSGTYERMLDSTGPIQANKSVTHEKFSWSTDPSVRTEVKGKPYSPDGGTTWIQKTYTYRSFLSDLVLGNRTHMTDVDVKALAVARVPAYAREKLESFISLAEMRDLVDVSTIRSAAALGRLAASLYMGIRRGRIPRGRVGRDLSRLLLGRGDLRAKGSLGTLLDGARRLNGAALGYKFGIKPLVDDIHGVIDATNRMQRLREDLIRGQRVYGRHHYVKETSTRLAAEYLEPSYGGNPGPFSYELRKRTTNLAVASIVRKLKPEAAYGDVGWFNSLDVVGELYGLKPTLRSGWQLLPLSFVVDWFWNVSDLLESFQSVKTPDSNLFTSSDGLYSLLQETRVTVSGFHSNASDTGSTSLSGTFRTYTRNTDSLTGVPAFYIPPLSLPTKAGQWLSIAQIAFQSLTGKKNRAN